MDGRTVTRSTRRRVSPLVGLGTFVLAVAALHFGKPVLIPLTIAILLTFLLNPVVDVLHRWGLRRAIAVLVVVFIVFSVLGTVTYALGTQVTLLAAGLPQYKDNLVRKISEFRKVGHSRGLERLQRAFKEVAGEIQRQDGPADDKKVDGAKKPDEKPVPVVVKGTDKSPAAYLPTAVGSVMEWFITVAMVLVLVIFMLLRLQELRNRIFRLVGYGRLTTTTRALDDAAARISRYLLMQTIINATYGLCVGFGLYLIGLPYVILLGFIAGIMRFIPYLGPPVGALLPLALSLGLFDSWMTTLMVLALFASLELITSMVMEPLLYGQSAGVSEVALLIAIAFWTWIWGPVGLALATPMTVCLVVLCKYVPELEFVEMLLGDEPVMDLPLVYYQRLLARDTDEAAELIQKYLKEHPLEEIFDNLFIPALHWVKRDSLRQQLDIDDQRFILQTTRELIESLDELQPPAAAPQSAVPDTDPAPRQIRITGCPAHDGADELGLQMLGRLLDPNRFHLEILSSEKLFSEMIAAIRETEPDIICVGALTPDPIAPARHLCKRLRDNFPNLRVLACRWGLRDEASGREQFVAAGADFGGVTLLEVRNHLLGLLPVLSAPATPATAPGPVSLEPVHAA